VFPGQKHLKYYINLLDRLYVDTTLG